MIDMRLVGVGVYRAVSAVAFALAAGVLGAALWGKPTLSFLWSLPGRLNLEGLSGRDWASVVAALAAAGAVFVVLCAVPLVWLLWEIIR